MKNKKRKYNIHRIDGIATLIASLIVLFASIIDSSWSFWVALAFLILYSLFKIFFDKRH